ncbi:MAG: toxin-antitoxin system HicB family antitoxin [Lachnospiraceae bacterium]|nr:toxin-antitoxin system HicB family antitoxin [Lachnospiraceae bacterium]
MSHHTLLQELIKQVGSKGLEGALHANKYKGSFNVRISPDLHRKIAIEAAEEKMTLNQYVIKALERSIAML